MSKCLNQYTQPPSTFDSKKEIWSFICSKIAEQHIWCATTKPAPGRTPSFLGSFAAVARFSSLPELTEETTMCLSPGPCRGELRDLVLEEFKNVTLVEPVSGQLGTYQKLVREKLEVVGLLGQKIFPNILVVGSMAVDMRGNRVGKEGDLTGVDFVLGELYQNPCLVVTLVHDCQVLKLIPPDILTQHDLPVDIIVTPTRIIRVNPKSNKPTDINWRLMKNDMVRRVPLLLERRNKDMKEGKSVRLGSSRNHERVWNGPRSEGNTTPTRPQICESEIKAKIKRNQMNMLSKFKFDNIPASVGYSGLKEALRLKEIVTGLCVITLRGGSAVVAFKEKPEEVVEKLKGWKIYSSMIKMEEVLLQVEVKQNVKEELDTKKKQVEKIRIDMIEETFARLQVLKISGIFIGKLPNGTTEDDIKKAMEVCNQVPVQLELGHRNRFAIAFFAEDTSVILSSLENMMIKGKDCQVEEYKPKMKQRFCAEPVVKPVEVGGQLAKTDCVRRPRRKTEESNLFKAFGGSPLALFSPTANQQEKCPRWFNK